MFREEPESRVVGGSPFGPTVAAPDAGFGMGGGSGFGMGGGAGAPFGSGGSGAPPFETSEAPMTLPPQFDTEKMAAENGGGEQDSVASMKMLLYRRILRHHIS